MLISSCLARSLAQLVDGASPEDRARLKLGAASDYHYLNQSDCYSLPGVDNGEEYKRTLLAMSRVGIPPADQAAIFAVVAAILHLGNVRFVSGADESSAPADDASANHLATAGEAQGVQCVCLGLSGDLLITQSLTVTLCPFSCHRSRIVGCGRTRAVHGADHPHAPDAGGPHCVAH
jgi:hypothetical protein